MESQSEYIVNYIEIQHPSQMLCLERDSEISWGRVGMRAYRCAELTSLSTVRRAFLPERVPFGRPCHGMTCRGEVSIEPNWQVSLSRKRVSVEGGPISRCVLEHFEISSKTSKYYGENFLSENLIDWWSSEPIGLEKRNDPGRVKLGIIEGLFGDESRVDWVGEEALHYGK